ncbi:MAG TPA: signal peptidase I [Nocardioidaceae bacterium]|nr:signal peptidase I [Nocardioidaceae bacterium]
MACAALVAGVVVPTVSGATPYTVLTGSMTPALDPGTLIVVRPVDSEQVAVGDVVTYQLRSGEPEVVTHRVVSVGINGDGERIFRTRGDANSVADGEWVRSIQLRGEVWYSVPHLGRVSTLMPRDVRRVLVLLVAATLLTYAALMFGGAAREARGGLHRRAERLA